MILKMILKMILVDEILWLIYSMVCFCRFFESFNNCKFNNGGCEMSVSLNTLPDEVKHLILWNLDAKSLGNCCRVSKQFNKLSSHDDLWKALFPEVSFPNGTSAKKYLDAHAVTSEDEIVQRIQKFVDKVPLNKIGSFKAICPFNPGCEVTVEIGYGILDSSKENLQEICLVMKKLKGPDNDPDRKVDNGFSQAGHSIKPEFSFSKLKFVPIRKEITTNSRFFLPYGENGFNNSFIIDQIVKDGITKLKETEKQQNRNFILGVAAVVVALVGITLNMYYNAANKDTSS